MGIWDDEVINLAVVVMMMSYSNTAFNNLTVNILIKIHFKN